MHFSKFLVRKITFTVVVLTSGAFFLGTSLSQSAQGQINLSQEIIASRSCNNLPSMNQSKVESRASPENLGTIRQNGGSFERKTLESLNLIKNNQGYRSDLRRSRYRIRTVIPDGVSGFIISYRRRRGLPYFRVYRESVFYDAKFVNESINYTYDSGQTLGYIDHLDKKSPAGRGRYRFRIRRPTPELHYMTPTNTVIGTSTIYEASLAGVAVYQHIVCDTVPAGGIIGINDLTVGKGILLNEGVYVGRNLPERAVIGTAYGLPFTLSDPPLPPPPDDGGGGGGGGGEPCSGCSTFNPYSTNTVLAATNTNFDRSLDSSSTYDPQVRMEQTNSSESYVVSGNAMAVGKWQGKSWEKKSQDSSDY